MQIRELQYLISPYNYDDRSIHTWHIQFGISSRDIIWLSRSRLSLGIWGADSRRIKFTAYFSLCPLCNVFQSIIDNIPLYTRRTITWRSIYVFFPLWRRQMVGLEFYCKITMYWIALRNRTFNIGAFIWL